MAVCIRLILLVLLGSFAGTSYARSVQASSMSDVGDDVFAEEEVTPDVVCNVAGCSYDMQLYCLSNGVIVMGSCSLKNILCTDGERNSLHLADGWDACFQATYTVVHHQQQVESDDMDGENGSETLVHTTSSSNHQQIPHARASAVNDATRTSSDAGADTDIDVEERQASDRLVEILSDLEDQLEGALK